MDFHDYWLSLKPGAEREAFAIKCGAKAGYLTLVAGGHKNASELLALRIEEASDGQVKAESLNGKVRAIRGLVASTEARAA